MIYSIPDFKLKKLEKQINHIRNKGADITFNILEPIKIEAENRDKVFTSGHKVEVNGSYKINGWEFVATIEHTPNGNIIRCINDSLESKIPEKYKTTGPECEHCHKIRGRKDTYLVYNSQNDEWKQVGKTCLQDYTGGLDSETCAQIASVFRICDEAEKWDDDGLFSWDSDKTIPSIIFKQYALPIVKKKGYKKDVTVDLILDAIYKRGIYGPYADARDREEAEMATEEELEPINEYANSVQDDQYGYFRNAKLAWLSDYVEYRDLPLIASFIGTYFKHQNELAQQKKNQETTKYVGNVGDKIEITISSCRVLYTKDNRMYSYYAEPSYVHEIIDTEGNVYICDCSKRLTDALKIRATIKGYTEYRGTKQTVLTRAKILEEKEKDKGMSNQEAFKALDSFIDDLEK